MTWKSHIAIATAVTLPFNPMAIPVAALGSTAPDWSEWIFILVWNWIFNSLDC
jgi:inner membrane protein